MSTPLSLQDLDLPRRNGELAFDAPWQSNRRRPRPPLLGKLDRRA